MMNCGMMNGNYGMAGWFGWSLVWLLYVIIGAFIFGVIFWWAYNLTANKNNKRK